MKDFINKIPKDSYVVAITMGVVAGLCFRMAVDLDIRGMKNLMGLMSMAFMFVAPLVIGVFTIVWLRKPNPTYIEAIFLPWLPIVLGTLATMALGWEGFICVAMFIPLGLVVSSVGGLIAKQFFCHKDPGKLSLIFGLLPIALQPIESQFASPEIVHEVQTKIEISASTANIWREIKSVPLIEGPEMPDSWVHWIGFPRPLSAEIDKEAVGGVRLAKFERGLVFIEKVTRWEENQVLSFTIDVDPEDIPPTALDEHVTIGGPFFDVLHGEYSIEKVDGERQFLHLKSRFRISTHFNWYARLWTEAVMQRIQKDILQVVKKRAEI